MFVLPRRFRPSFSMILASMVIFSMTVFVSCDDEEVVEPPPTVYGSADVNGAYTSYTRATFKVSPTTDGRVKNLITISRSDNSQIVISFIGTELAEFELPNADTLNSCKYIDASDRVFKSDTGKIIINDYYVREGIVTASGGFEFEGDFINPTTGLVTQVEVSNGGFVNVKSN